MKNRTVSLWCMEVRCRLAWQGVLVVPLGLFWWFCVHAWQQTAQVYQIASGGDACLSFADLVCLAWQGAVVYHPDPNIPFRIPALWLTQQLYLLMFVCWLPAAPATGFWRDALVKTASRKQWWTARCLAAGLFVALEYAVQYILLFALSGDRTAPFSLSVQTLEKAFSISLEPGQREIWWVYLLLLPLCGSLALALLQMVLSLWLGAVGGFFAASVYTALAAYLDSPLLFMGYAMPLRSRLCGAHGTAPALCIAVLLAAAVLLFAVGRAVFAKMDILQEEGTNR